MPASNETVTAHTRIWLEKAVIGLNLCPFAKAPYNKGLVRINISRAKHPDGFLKDFDGELQRLADAPPAEVETTLLVHPEPFGNFFAFNDMLDFAEQAIRDNGLEGVIQTAPFHPGFQFEGTQPGDITNFTNRSPYPTLRLIRESSTSKAAEAVFGRNIALLEKMGHEGWAELHIPRCPAHVKKPQT